MERVERTTESSRQKSLLDQTFFILIYLVNEIVFLSGRKSQGILIVMSVTTKTIFRNLLQVPVGLVVF